MAAAGVAAVAGGVEAVAGVAAVVAAAGAEVLVAAVVGCGGLAQTSKPSLTPQG